MQRYIYDPDHGQPLGHHHAEDGDPPMDQRPLHPQLLAPGMPTMADVDMDPGTEVTVRLHTGEGVTWGDPGKDHLGRVVVEWSDRHGSPRATSFEPEFFAEHFAAVNTT